MAGFTGSGAVSRSDVASEPGTSVSVGTASTALLAAATGERVQVTVCNDHATNVVYLSLGGTAVANKGIRLNAAGGTWTSSAYTGAITAISTGATTNVTVTVV